MNFEPEKFFIGLVDFFSIILPGGLAAYLAKDYAAFHLLGQEEFRLDGTEQWMVFLFVSYLLGHFAFLVGSFLDELIYENFRNCTFWGQVRRLAEGKRRSWGAARWLAETFWFFGKGADEAIMRAQRIKAHALQAIGASNAINTFQWSKARLSKDHPQGLIAVQRFEADSKFFRSFVVVLTVVSVIYFAHCRIGAGLLCGGLVVPALLRYVDQRFKATQQAYVFVITLEAMQPQAGVKAARAGAITHAGGVVFRECKDKGKNKDKDKDKVEYLLVRAKGEPAQWVLPKGHIEAGESATETAVREVYEEAGCWACILQGMGTKTFSWPTSTVAFYLMEYVSELTDEELARQRWNQPLENRGRAWLPLAEAKEKASFDETKRLLDQADDARKKISPKSLICRAIGWVRGSSPCPARPR
jgi:8-oxo-dGTP pyrophosphatase MutT (NUDIX family)